MQFPASRARFVLLATVLAVATGALGFNRTAAQSEAKKATSYPRQILIIRHAEKTGEKGDIHLAKAGKERAERLYELFVPAAGRPEPFPTPDFIFAASHHKDSRRPFETVTPLAFTLKLPINQTFNNKVGKKPGTEELREEIFSQSKYFGKTILIAWRHSTMPDLAKSAQSGQAALRNGKMAYSTGFGKSPTTTRVRQLSWTDPSDCCRAMRTGNSRISGGDAVADWVAALLHDPHG